MAERVDISDSRAVREALSRDESWGPIYLDEDSEPIAHACGLCGAVVSKLPDYRQAHVEFHVVVGSCFDALLKSRTDKPWPRT